MKKSKFSDFFIDFDTNARFKPKNSDEHHCGYSSEKLKGD